MVKLRGVDGEERGNARVEEKKIRAKKYFTRTQRGRHIDPEERSI